MPKGNSGIKRNKGKKLKRASLFAGKAAPTSGETPVEANERVLKKYIEEKIQEFSLVNDAIHKKAGELYSQATPEAAREYIKGLTTREIQQIAAISEKGLGGVYQSSGNYALDAVNRASTKAEKAARLYSLTVGRYLDVKERADQIRRSRQAENKRMR